MRSNRFGFNITGGSNLVIVVEACTNLANPTWSPLATNILTTSLSYTYTTNGAKMSTNSFAYFSDPQWTNYPARFYRLRSP